jgi:hypothetical protein
VLVHRFSQSALAKIEKSGSQAIVLAGKKTVVNGPGKKGAAPGSEVRAFVPPRSYMRAGFDEAKEAAVAAIEVEAGRRMEALSGPRCLSGASGCVSLGANASAPR